MGLDLARIDSDALAIASHVQEIHELGASLIKSGLLPQTVKTPEAAVAIILKGRELGLPVMQSFDAIDNIQGKPTLKPQTMLALIYASSQCAGVEIDSTADECVVTMKRKMNGGVFEHTERFSIGDAQKLGLAGKDNWKKQPKTMLKWRAVAACARVVFPDVIQNMYTPEEALSMVVEEANGHDDAQDAEFKPVGSKAERLAAKLKPEEPVATESEFPPDPPEGALNETAREPSITSGQATALSVALKEAGFKTSKEGKEQGRAFVAFLTDRDELESIKDLTKAQASRALDAIGGEVEGEYRVDREQLQSRLSAWEEHRAGREVEGLFDEEEAG